MVRSCCAINCTNRFDDDCRARKITFHLFPADERRRAAWIRAVRRMDPRTKKLWQPSTSSVLCSCHFNVASFRFDRGNTLLKPDAVPTIFAFPNSRGMARQSTNTGRVRRSDLELFMECEEEELTPSQRQANVQAQKDYKTALQNLEKPKTACAPRSVQARKGAASTPQVPVRPKRRYTSDVIVIDDDASATATVFPVAKLGRPPNSSRNSTNSTKNSHANFYSSSASSGGNLIVVSSDVPDIPATRSSPGGMNIPTSYMTLPTVVQPTFGLPSGRKVMLKVPMDGPGDEDFVISAGINRVQSTFSLPGNRVQRGRPRHVVNHSIPSTVDDVADDDDDDDVKIVEPFEIADRVGSNAVSARMRLHHGPENSHAFETRTRKTAVKRSAGMVQRAVEKQGQSAPKKPRLVASVGRKRQYGRNDDFSCCSQTKNHQTSGRPGSRKRQEKDVTEEDSNSIWIPVDEYYYGKKEGDPSYREDKGEYRFKCWYCHKMLYNNLRLMVHMQGHIDNDKQQNLDLSDLTQCKHCYGQFDTPFEMQCHIEKVHQNKSNILVCRICEKDHDSEAVLRQHMKNFHSSCEMPYTCSLCNFRSSVYSDVVNHFKKRHDSSQYVLCLYCLKTFKISFCKSVGWGMTQSFYQHIQKHQNKSNNKKCICCKLTFLTKQETDHHRARDHLPNYRGTQNSHATVDSNKEKVLICLKETGVKLLSAPSSSKSCEVRVLQFDGVSNEQLCLECKKPLNSSYHFRNYSECTLCRFATSCSVTFSTHMTKRHSGIESKRKALTRREVKMERKMYCLCGFASVHGNLLANHLVSCSKRTCYSGQREAKYFEYDDEQEDSTPFEPYIEEILGQEASSSDAEVPSLFGALGLIKKQRKCSRQRSRIPGPRTRPQVSSKSIVNGIIEDLIDSMFPAEAAAAYVLNYLLDQVVKPRVKSPAKKNLPLTIAGDIVTETPLVVAQRDGETVEPVATLKRSPDCQMMAVDSPKMEPTESAYNDVEDFTHSKLNVESIKTELDGVFCDMPDVEQRETSAESEGSTTVEGNPCTQTLKEEAKQIVKAEIPENSEEDENCDDIIDAEIQLSTDESCLISDDFLISLDDENAEVTEDFGEHGTVSENAINTAEVEQSSANGFACENQGGSVVMNVDDTVCSNTGRNVADLDEKDVSQTAEIVENYDSADALYKEPNDLHHNSDLDSIQQANDVEMVVMQEQDSVNTDKICEAVIQEDIGRSAFEEEKVSPCPNICDLEDDSMSVELIDDYTDEQNLEDCEQTSTKEDGLSLTSSQAVSSDCVSKLAEFTDGLVAEVGDVENVATYGQNSECQTFAGQPGAYPLVNSPLENENVCGGEARNDASDICHVVTSCENEINPKDCHGTELESFHDDAEKTTSSVSVNFDDRGIEVDKDKDVETKSSSQSSKVARTDVAATKLLESRSETESAKLDKGKPKEIPALNDVHAKTTTRCPEAKIKNPESLGSKSQASSLEDSSKDSHSSRHHGLMGTSGHRDSHKPDASHNRDRKYKDRDERRDSTDYERRGFGPRDYDRRSFNQRDFDRRGYDRQDYDRRDHGNRNYRQCDRGGGNGGYKNEGYDHGYRQERDDRYDRRDHFSRRDYGRNDQNRNRYNSNNSYQRNNYY